MKRIALIGAGRIGTHHARTIAKEVDGVGLALLADPAAPDLDGLAAELDVGHGAPATSRDPLAAATDPAIDAVVITAPAASHAELI